MQLSIIIVNYKSARLVRNCLRSIFESHIDFPFEVIVVDNDSHDGMGELLAKEFPAVKFIQSEKNTGMGSGNNLGARHASGKYLFIVNPDIFFFPDSIKKLVDYLKQNESVGVLAPQLLNADRTPQHACYRRHGLLTPIYRRTFLGKMPFAKKDLARFLLLDKNHDEIFEPDWIQGSCVMIPKKVFESVGGFDEDFFMYFEDTDLCRRIKNNGHRIVHYPESKVIHLHRKQSGGGATQLFFNKTARAHIVSWIKYLWKWRLKNPKF